MSLGGRAAFLEGLRKFTESFQTSKDKLEAWQPICLRIWHSRPSSSRRFELKVVTLAGARTKLPKSSALSRPDNTEWLASVR
jgi:hypothetical protein